VSANGALHASNTTKPVARREGAGVGVAVAPICRNISGSRSGSLNDGRIASERLKNVGEDRRSTLEDCVRKNTGQKKQKCKNCEGKGTLKKGDKIVRCRRCGGTGIKP
jgi:DnaJ-class molecular chaperone